MSTDRPSEKFNCPIPYDAPIEILKQQIGTPGPSAWVAFIALAFHPNTEAISLLVEYANHSDWTYRRISIESIGLSPKATSLSHILVGALDDQNSYVIQTACDTIAKNKLKEANDKVCQLLLSTDPNIRRSALLTLADIWQPSCFRKVVNLFQTERNETVRKEAAWTLRKQVDKTSWRELFELWQRDSLSRHRLFACEIAEEFGNNAVRDKITMLLNDKDGHVIKAATRVLQKLT